MEKHMADQKPLHTEEELRKLQQELEIYNKAYYDLDQPLISDAEYDLLMRRFRELEKLHPEWVSEDSPAQKVGGHADRTKERVRHIYPMLSLQDVFNLDEVEAFYRRVLADFPQAKFIVEEKIDGLSLGIRYRDGDFQLAHTRGDGHSYGEDVSENAREITNLPQRCDSAPGELFLRAEVYMSYRDFEEANAQQESEGKMLFANPRNAAAGTLRQLDPTITGQRGLRCFVFDLVHFEGKAFDTDSEALEWLKKSGFPIISKTEPLTELDEIRAAIEAIGRRRSELPYGIDGAVIKVDQLPIRQHLGASSKTPRWAVAYKYPPEACETRVEDILVQVGRTGKLTPLAVLDPVLISGSCVSRASLHNQTIIDTLDIRIGDQVMISKSGDIIPMVVEVLKEKRPEGTRPFHMPDRCPVCGAEVDTRDGSVDLYCQGSDCPAQLSRKLQYFASKSGMDIDGLGEQSVEQLIQAGYLKSIGDIYDLYQYRDELIKAGSIGREKRIDNLLNAIERSKENEAWRLLAALGIPLVGPQTAKNLMKYFSSIDELAEADSEALTACRDVGETMALSIREYFRQPQTRALIQHLKRAGVRMSAENASQTGKLPLEGMKIVITGSFSSMTRAELRGKLERAGAEVPSSVSGKTSFLLAGEDAGSKLDKAKELGIPLLDLDSLESLLEGKS